MVRHRPKYITTDPEITKQTQHRSERHQQRRLLGSKTRQSSRFNNLVSLAIHSLELGKKTRMGDGTSEGWGRDAGSIRNKVRTHTRLEKTKADASLFLGPTNCSQTRDQPQAIPGPGARNDTHKGGAPERTG